MYNNILAAVNEYSNSEMAARYAIHLAGACSARLTLMFVAGSQVGLGEIRPAESGAGASLSGGRRQSGGSGEPHPKRRPLAADQHRGPGKSHGSGLQRHPSGQDVNRRYFARTLSRQLMLRLPCSVALVRVVHPGKFFPQKILVPFRGRPALQDEKAFFVAKVSRGLRGPGDPVSCPRIPGRIFPGQHPDIAAGADAAGDRAV